MPDTEVATKPQPSLAAIVERYVQLRDTKAAMKAAYEKEAAKIQEALDRIESFMLKHLQDADSESVRTSAGTFFRTRRTSATVADWDATLEWIKDNEAWAMLEKRVSKAFVEEYKEAHNDLPPGLNYREELTVNVRRS